MFDYLLLFVYFIIFLHNACKQLSIYKMKFQEPKSGHNKLKEVTIDVSALWRYGSGLYFLQILKGNEDIERSIRVPTSEIENYLARRLPVFCRQ